MSKIEHPNIIHLYDIMQDSLNFFLVMDYCDHGDLLEHQRKQPRTRFTEAQAVKYLSHIRDAFLCLRNHNIMHRDIKLENLFVDKDDNLKIGDFGFAKEGLDESFTKLGSHNTMAPEILLNIFNQEKKYDSKCDLWSIGVVFHIMLFGRKPYFCDLPKADLNNFRHMIRSLKHFQVSSLNLEGISAESSNLLSRLLRKNPQERISKLDQASANSSLIPFSANTTSKWTRPCWSNSNGSWPKRPKNTTSGNCIFSTGQSNLSQTTSFLARIVQ